MLKASVLVQILTNSFCFDFTSVQLLESCLHSLAQILLRFCSYLAQIFCSDLFALLTFVNLKIFLLRYFTQISCSDLAQILLKYLTQILLRSCLNILLRFICSVNTCWLKNLLAQISYSDLAQILLRFCLNLFVLSTLVDLRIFLLKSESSKISEQEVYFASCILLLVSCFILTL